MAELIEQYVPYVREQGLKTNKAITYGTAKATATSVAAAVTLNSPNGIITTENLTTASGGTYNLTVTNSFISANSYTGVDVFFGTNTTGNPAITTVTASAGQVIISVQNIHGAAALNGTLKFTYVVL